MEVHGGPGDGSVCYKDQGRCPGPGKTDSGRTGASLPSASLTQAGLALLLESTWPDPHPASSWYLLASREKKKRDQELRKTQN